VYDKGKKTNALFLNYFIEIISFYTCR